MNARPLTFVLAALLLSSPALAAAPGRSADAPVSATTLTATTAASETQAYASSGSAPSGTGRLFAGAFVGLLASGEVAPNFGLQVAGPIRLAGLPPKLHLEWTGALDFWFSSESVGSGNFEVDATQFSVGVIPGARIVVPIVPEVLLHGDLGVGFAFTNTSVESNFGGGDSNSDFGVVFRLAAGAIIPLSETVRLDVSPLGLQAYAPGGTAFSMQVGISFALQ
jgi:hypothetical protein